MSDAAQVTLVIGVVIVILAYMFLKMRTGKVDIGVKLPLGANISATVSEGERKTEVAEQSGMTVEAVEELVSPTNPFSKWQHEKVADIYWIGSDLMWSALATQIGGQQQDVIRRIDLSFWHAEQLRLDPMITGRLEKLLQRANAVSEWDAQTRQHIFSELNAIISVVGLVMEAADPDFIPERSTTPSNGQLVIIDARWGSDKGAKDGWKDVADILRANILHGRLKIVASKGNLGEPNPGVRKVLKVMYSYKGVTHTKEVNEDEPLELP